MMTTNYTILVIEDDYDTAENICSILKLANYNVLYAANGRSGVTLAKQEHPDLILCDIIMPELDGYAVLHILNKDLEFQNVPFIFLTAKVDSHDFRDGMNLGADDYITKPFQGLDLLKVIEIRLKKLTQLKISIASANDHLNNVNVGANGKTDLERITAHKNVRSFNRKDLIFMEGQSAFDLYFIHSGYVKTYKVNYEGKELITGFYHGGDFLGYIPLLEERCHHESAEVIEDAEVSIIPKHDFLEIIYSSRSMAKKFLKLLSANLVETENRLLDIAYQSVRQRVAGTLLKISSQPGNPDAKSVITMTRKDISNIIGTTSESLNRTLADFKEEGLIEIRDEGIIILERNKLQRNCRQPSFTTPRVLSSV